MASITLNWTASDTATGGTPTQYDIFRATGNADADTVKLANDLIGSVAGNVTTFEDTSVTAGTSYSYTVEARNAGGASDPADNTSARNILA